MSVPVRTGAERFVCSCRFHGLREVMRRCDDRGRRRLPRIAFQVFSYRITEVTQLQNYSGFAPRFSAKSVEADYSSAKLPRISGREKDGKTLSFILGRCLIEYSSRTTSAGLRFFRAIHLRHRDHSLQFLAGLASHGDAMSARLYNALGSCIETETSVSYVCRYGIANMSVSSPIGVRWKSIRTQPFLSSS